MQRIENLLINAVIEIAEEIWNAKIDNTSIQIQKTRKEFNGDLTIVTFPLVRFAKMKPEDTAEKLGNVLVEKLEFIVSFNVIKGFLNLVISNKYWHDFLETAGNDDHFGVISPVEDAPVVMVEYSSPNTNKPLHLGHIRNNLLGFSISKILEATGKKVVKVNIVNDRGIHICKSMIAWLKFGNGETPSSVMKGDHLVGKYYVRYDLEFKKQVEEMVKKGLSREEAEASAPILQEAREMLRKWEAEDKETRELWAKMNSWVYNGFEKTYKRLGVSFDKIYYESDTYKLGRDIVLNGLSKGVLEKESDGSVWADLTDKKLDRKLLLRADGTSVYMTQDLGTAHQRFVEYPEMQEHIYVVGNEQNYHFQVLAIILGKLGFPWYDKLYHLSYGMVELPEGKMKSREGTVVDADDLMDEMIHTAKMMSEELGKLNDFSDEEKEGIYRKVGMAALKYFILKVDPKKNMLFDPKESVDFNGNTGPFIQYTYARIQSVLRSTKQEESAVPVIQINDKEIDVLRLLHDFPSIIESAAAEHNPSLIANFLYDLAKEFNQFYHDHSILNANDPDTRLFRIHLSKVVGDTIERGMGLLGIEVPERM